VPREIKTTVRIGGALCDFVMTMVGPGRDYENASEYIHDLIRRDMERVRRQASDSLEAELNRAFAAPEERYTRLTAADVIARNQI